MGGKAVSGARMEYTKLGKSGVEISKFCVGWMSFGKTSADFHEWTLDSEKTEAVVRHALDLGIHFFDTANTYAHGTSEEHPARPGCPCLQSLL